MNMKEELKQFAEKEKGIWNKMDATEKELVIIVVMIAVALAALTSWFFF
jgi:flagellar biosynthesis/type III secretory pathway M-ring protein FliF/YscJ